MKRIWKKIILTVIFILAFVFASIYAFLSLSGKAIISKALSNLTHQEVYVENFILTPPLNIEIKGLNIAGVAKIESIAIAPSIPFLLTGNIALNSIRVVKPEIFYERLNGEAVKPMGETPAVQIKEEVEAKPARPLRLIIKRLDVKGGMLNLIDRTVGGEGIKITVKDLNFNLTNLYIFPVSAIANFHLKGNIPWKEGNTEGKIFAEGYMDLFKKDIQATLKISDIDGVYLYPYYSTWVDLEKARIQSASLAFSSNIHGLNNDVTADCRLELTNIVRKPRSPDEPREKAEKITDVVLDIFKAMSNGNIVLDFTIKTKMDSPQFGFGNIKAAFEEKLARSRAGGAIKPKDVLMLPAKLIEGTIKGATDISMAVVDGTFAVGNEIKKAVEVTFKKETPPQEDSDEPAK